jgi:hypothetical protein
MKSLDYSLGEHRVTFVSPGLLSELEKRFRNYVARRAFALYERSGRPKGKDWQHWLQAESEYLFARPKVLESEDRISLFAVIPEKPPRCIQICMAPMRVIIKTTLLHTDPEQPGPAKDTQPPEQFLLAHWTKEVDPENADATLNGSLLMLSALKVAPQGSRRQTNSSCTMHPVVA